MKPRNNKVTRKRSNKYAFGKMGSLVINGLRWKAIHEGNIAVKASRRGKRPSMAGPIRPMEIDGLYEIDSKGVKYQRDPFCGALVRV